jgi:pyrroline-5-carboxylate reductase
VVALFSSSAGPEQWAAVERLMVPLGLVERIADEGLLDAVTALSGCGPAFVYRFIDALARAGAVLGLPPEQAERLALATVEGAGALAAAAEVSPAVLADRVASPGGSTREGLDVLDRDGALDRLLQATLRAAADRNAAMAVTARG